MSIRHLPYCRPAQARFITAVLALFCCAVGAAQQPIKNEDLVKLKKAGIEDGAVLKMIETGPTTFDTSVQAIVSLKESGVSDRVIEAVVSSGRSADGALYDVPDEIGVYSEWQGRMRPLKTEIVTLRTGGVVKSLTTLGTTKGHLNAILAAPKSPVLLGSRSDFFVRTMDGVTGEEFQLLRLWTKTSRREFRIMTGGVVHSSIGADENVVAVGVVRLGTRLYGIKPAYPLQPGEYGFLPPGVAHSASAASAGKIYTFRVEAAK